MMTRPESVNLIALDKQVDQDLPQPVLVGIDRDRKPVRRLENEFDALAAGLQPEHVDELIEELAQPHFVAVEMEAAGFDLGDVEQAVDQAGQVFGVAADHPDRIEAPQRDGGIALQDLGIADHRIERRAQLVAQPDDIAALRLAGGFRGFLGLLQLRVGSLVRLDLLHQQLGLALRLFLGDAPALVHEHEHPRGDGGDDRENEEHRPQRRACRMSCCTFDSNETWK